MNAELIYQSVGRVVIAGVLALSVGQYIVCISAQLLSVGSSMVPATVSFRWQYNASNGVVFIGILAQILIFIHRCIGTAVVSFIGVLARILVCP